MCAVIDGPTLARAAATWHLDQLSSLSISKLTALVSPITGLPPLEGAKVAGLAHQLNVPANAVAEAFEEAWASANRSLGV